MPVIGVIIPHTIACIFFVYLDAYMHVVDFDDGFYVGKYTCPMDGIMIYHLAGANRMELDMELLGSNLQLPAGFDQHILVIRIIVSDYQDPVMNESGFHGVSFTGFVAVAEVGSRKGGQTNSPRAIPMK